MSSEGRSGRPPSPASTLASAGQGPASTPSGAGRTAGADCCPSGLLDRLDEAILTWDAAGNVTAINRAAQRLYDVRAADVIGQPLETVFSWAWPTPEAADSFRSSLARASEWRGATVQRLRTGITIAAEITVWIDSAADGQSDATSLAVHRTTTARSEPVQAADVLAENEFYRQIIESIPGMVFTTRPDGFCDYQSRQWVEYTGVPLQRHLGDGWNDLLHPDDQLPAHSLWKAAVEGRCEYNLEYRVRRRDGEYEWFKVIGRPIRDTSGQVVRWFGVAANIDGLKRAEAARRESEKTLAIALAAADMGTWTYQFDTRLCRYSEAARRLYGVTWEEAIVDDAFVGALLHPDDIRSMWMAMARACDPAGPGRFETEYRVRGADVPGGWRWLNVWGKVEWSPEGDKPLRMVGASRDVSAAKLAERQLADELQTARHLQEVSVQLIGTERIEVLYGKILDTAMAILRADCGSLQLLQEDERRPGGLWLLEHRGFDAAAAAFWCWVRPGSRSTCGRALETHQRVFVGDVLDCEWMQGSEDLQAYLVNGVRAVQTTPLVSRSGQLLGMISTHWRQPHRSADNELWAMDILARQAADLIERKLGEDALRRRAEEIERLMEAVPAAVWVAHDKECARITGNRRANEFYEAYDGENVSASAVPEARRFFSADGRELAPAELPIQLAAATNRTVGEVELHVLLRSGRRIAMLGMAVPLRDEQGQVRGCIGAFLDITARKDVETRLRVAMATAEEANRAKDHFLAVLSHELRTPLTPVLAIAEMLQADAGLPPEHRELLQTIRRNVQLEARLIDDLLDLTRIARNKLELQLSSIDVHEKIRHVIEMCRSDIDAKRLTVELRLEARLHHLQADAARIQQVIWNLVKNAVKFTAEAGHVWISTADAAGGQLILEVRDDGRGLDEELLPRVFDAFVQGGREVTRQFGGLGLGLAISKALVEMHGGAISAASPGAGQGATFRVVLPASTSAPRPTGVPAGLKPVFDCTVLLVEDHADTRRSLAFLLARLGCRVTAAGSKSEALAAAARDRFQLVISDIGLPDGSGADLMRELRAQQGCPGIALSGYGMDDDRSRSADAGFAVHLIKPVNVQQLAEAIRRVVGPD